MDLLDRLLAHDAWTKRQFLLLCQSLTDDQLDHDIDIGHRTVRRTFAHLIYNIEVWTDLMAAVPQRAAEGQSVAELIARLDRASADLARLARSVAAEDRWDEQFTDVLENPPIKHTFGAGIAHVITHSMHHRAQLLYMMRRLGIQNLPEGDVLSWEKQAR